MGDNTVYFERQSFENLQEGIKLYRKNDWEGAIREFMSKKPGDADSEESLELIYYLGLCYTKLGKYDEALACFEKIVSEHNDILRIYQCRMALAYIYVITKRAKMAEFELNRLRVHGLESPLLYNTLAFAAWSQRKAKNAIEFYEKTLEIDSNNATAMNSMGFILVDTEMDIMRGLRLCRKAVDAKPQNPAYMDSLGWAYFKSGEIMEARTWLRRALELAPNNKEIQKHYHIVAGVPV